MADTYGKISDDYVRFIWMAAQSALTNFCLSEPSSAEASLALQDDYAVRRGSLFSHLRVTVQIGAALAKAAAARFLQDSVDDGLPIRVL